MCLCFIFIFLNTPSPKRVILSFLLIRHRCTVAIYIPGTDLRCIALSFNSVLRAVAALSTPVEVELFQSVGVVKRASLDHCRR